MTSKEILKELYKDNSVEPSEKDLDCPSHYEELMSYCDESDIDTLIDAINHRCPEALQKYDKLDLAWLYHIWSEFIWEASWEDNAENTFAFWLALYVCEEEDND